MTDKERLNEAYDWLAHVRKLAGETKDEGYFQRRLTTLEWLIEQAEKEVQVDSSSLNGGEDKTE